MEFDLFTLLPLAAAVFVFWKLRSVLGSRDGAPPPAMPPVGDERAPREGADNVVTLPNARRERGADTKKRDAALAKSVAQHADGDESVAEGLTAIAARDPDFHPDEFLKGARMAYEMIVTEFADGDKDALRGLLSPEVHANFAAAIDERVERGESVRSTFVGIEKSAITGAGVTKDEANITVSFTSQIISATLDKSGEVVDGDPDEVAEVNDVWTFARPLRSTDPNWQLVATDA